MSENVVLYCLANSINVAAKFKFPQLAIKLRQFNEVMKGLH